MGAPGPSGPRESIPVIETGSGKPTSSTKSGLWVTVALILVILATVGVLFNRRTATTKAESGSGNRRSETVAQSPRTTIDEPPIKPTAPQAPSVTAEPLPVVLRNG